MMMNKQRVVITGIGIGIPGYESWNDIEAARLGPHAVKAIQPEEKLGKKGLRYKDRATKLAFCAAVEALRDASLGQTPDQQVEPAHFGTIASSNFGNVDTVCKVLETLRNEGVKGARPMDLPNASSNNLSASLAIRFGLQALNLMVCSGTTSGIDALYLGANAIAAGRAKRILIVGVENLNHYVQKLFKESVLTWLGACPVNHLLDGAAALILESEQAAIEREAGIYAGLSQFGFGNKLCDTMANITTDGTDQIGLWMTPNGAYPPTHMQIRQCRSLWDGLPPPRQLDLNEVLGEAYGALGVLQCAYASHWMRKHPSNATIATVGGCLEDCYAGVMLKPSDP